MADHPFTRVLIANRGEIAIRICRTLRRMGIASVAVYTDVDRYAAHVAAADEAVGIGAPTAYLDADRVVAAAVERGCQAIHPGYGFLSENPALARACAAAGITFIGPPTAAVDLMGDKINAKQAVAARGVPVVPGRDEAGLDDQQLADAARAVGFPVILKPSAGGGGKGMKVVTDPAGLAEAIATARREAIGAFGDGTLLVERFIESPRHIEMQIFADTHGKVLALGERECSLQRRHQKIVEEAPSPLLDPTTRAAMAESAAEAARACSYVGAGTVEFIVSADRPDEYFFMEMNTRLQVEHPVTEEVLRIDLVEWQLRVAAGEPLPWSSQEDVPAPRGHAVEARIYAEDPERGFLPSSGPVLALVEPEGEGIRVDSGLVVGTSVGTYYDPMLAKVIAWGDDRDEAVARLAAALRRTSILGLATNVGFLTRLLDDDDVRAGRLDTGLVERRLADLGRGPVPATVAAVAARVSVPDAPGTGPWDQRDGWRVGDPAPVVRRWRSGDQIIATSLLSGQVTIDGDEMVSGELPSGVEWVVDGADVWVGAGGQAWRLAPAPPVPLRSGRSQDHGGQVTSPMPGAVVAVNVTPGQAVTAGQALVAVEAMKMEHLIRAPADGTVTEVLVTAGQQVKLDQALVVFEAGSAPEEDG
ncbi:MAG TPA: biotin carboxylase N-terminal domain-containing protein [Acidimicrobiales bacterium]|nr:biotin carboxylase N-terminal domain-containing protein [Acidimicrobiales bacterium]